MSRDESRIRLVVLNYNGGDNVVRCVRALAALDWPAGALDLVVVDNGSTDGSAERVERERLGARVIRNGENRGFPGNNSALTDLDGVRYVGLVNDDLFVEPGWLGPLVDALDADPGLGAVSSRMLFEPRFVDLHLTTEATSRGRGDRRLVGVQVAGLRLDGIDRWTLTQFGYGGHGVESSSLATSQWTGPDATLRVPFESSREPGPHGTLSGVVGVLVSADSTKSVTFDGGAGAVTVEVGGTARWVELPVSGRPYDVINNVGSVVLVDGSGADRGLGEVDSGQFDESSEVFAWCGGSVLLRPSYLEAVGLFDERFFLYYEDLDLSWRGRAQGWRYGYVASSIARHLHGASSGEGSEVFAFHVERNRLLTLVKNAPMPMVMKAVVKFVLVTGSYARRDIVGAMVDRRRPKATVVRRRIASFFGFLRLAPSMLVDRRHLRRRQRVSDDELARWFVTR